MSAKENLSAIIREFPRRRLLVIGDIMIDRFIWGTVERISPEAPVPVVRVEREEVRAGGAANVAFNLLGLGAKVHLAGAVGDDREAETIYERLREAGIDEKCVVSERSRPTTIKTRVIAHSQQVVRFDREATHTLGANARRRLMQTIEREIAQFDGIIISDYGKGLLSRTIMDRLRDIAKKRRILIAVDPKIRNLTHFHRVDLLTPNHHEAAEILGVKLGLDDRSVESAGKRILKKLELGSLIITRAQLGMSLFRPGRRPTHIPTVARQVYDVTGAGDAVIAATCLARVSGASWEAAAMLANHAAGIVVGKVGTAAASVEELRDAIRHAHEPAAP
ncbi:MAG: D-glycero-beta-D-manno-heptose-7-phosphate kinase [Deltaproteobacteria bacterium]|nr:D-glycero-beta-D-manno-heptose-7-phosphate kinase [Deltaproteobacteria bacterium]